MNEAIRELQEAERSVTNHRYQRKLLLEAVEAEEGALDEAYERLNAAQQALIATALTQKAAA